MNDYGIKKNSEYVSMSLRTDRVSADLQASQATKPIRDGGLFLIVHDAFGKRIEIPKGSGSVGVCIGHFIEHRDGQKVYVPIFETIGF